MRVTALILILMASMLFAQTDTQGATAPAPQTVSAGQATGQEAAPAEAGGQTAAAQTSQDTQPQTCMGGGGIMSFVPMIAIIAIFYFLMIRPQQKQAKMLREMRDALQKDDRVVTSGGIHGVITNLKGDVVTVRIADGVKIDVDRNSLQVESVNVENS